MNRHGRRLRDGLLFRSSRTDFLNEREKSVIQRLGIKAIIDLRRKQEYERAEGDKILDEVFKPCVVKKGQVEEWKPSMRWGGADAARKRKRAAASDSSEGSSAVDGGSPPPARPSGRRYLVNMMTMDLIWYVFCQVNFFIRYISLILALVDWIFGWNLFVRLFNWLVLNRHPLSKQYVDLLEYAKPAVADILRLIICGENVPALIHCAHGKDRTGVIIAVILGALEVDDETIAQDYAKSESGLEPIKERLYRETVGRYGFNEDYVRADAATMREVLSELKRRYGSVSEYLESAGFTQAEQQQLKELFLETPAASSGSESDN